MSNIKEPIKVGAVQMDCIRGDKRQNLKKAITLLDEACNKGANLVVLPELFSTGYSVKDYDMDLAENIPGETTENLKNIAKERGVYIAGAILEHGESQGVIYDTAFFISPDRIEGTYRKIFLWDSERTRFRHGYSFPIFKSNFGIVGMQICYEVGFPEGARILTLKGADILLYHAAFSAQKYYVWDIATRSRALENGVFLIASNRSGKEDTLEFAGHSRIINPKGEILCEATHLDEVIVFPIDLDLVPKQRREIPYLRDYEKAILLDSLNNI
ncbi:MAG TPA: carbon-nitrogen hydrolase family protein [Candidatus Atribacteria bacterium]|nr:carbon-nitrogen hydrolase family protein [Candidatus Atribacteria bacterium]